MPSVTARPFAPAKQWRMPPAAGAVRAALMRCAQPMIASSVVVAGGFAVTLWGG